MNVWVGKLSLKVLFVFCVLRRPPTPFALEANIDFHPRKTSFFAAWAYKATWSYTCMCVGVYFRWTRRWAMKEEGEEEESHHESLHSDIIDDFQNRYLSAAEYINYKVISQSRSSHSSSPLFRPHPPSGRNNVLCSTSWGDRRQRVKKTITKTEHNGL